MKYLDRVYPWLLLSPVILPVVIYGGLIYPYLVPKTLLFYALSLLSVAAFVLLVACGRPFFFARLGTRETWIPAALLLLASIASVAGIDFYRSFWSLLVRGDGFLMLACVVADFYLILLFADRLFFLRLVQAVAVVASGVALYGIGEWVFGGAGRIGSLLGNAAFFAGYLGISFFVTLIAADGLSRGWRKAAYIGSALQVVAIVLTATRGTMLALGVAGVVVLGYLSSRRGKWRGSAAGVLIALAALVGVFFVFRTELAHIPFTPVARIASIGTSDPDVASRLFIWGNMVKEIEKAPLLGVGAEHIDALFNRFYDPTKILEQWFDRSHNAFLDYGAQYGVGGLLLYLALIASFFIAGKRLLRSGERRTAALVTLLALTYAVQNFFVFDTVSSFWLLCAVLAVSLSRSLEGAPRSVLPLPSWMRPGSWVVAIALVLLIFPVSFVPALAAYDLMQAYLYQIVDVPKETSYLSHGVALGTYATLEYGYEAYDMYVNHQVPTLPGDTLAMAYQSALSVLTAEFNRFNYDARTALYLAHVLSLAPPGVSVDSKLFSAALERAIRLSPKRAQPWYILVNLSLSEANTHPVGSQARTAGYAAAHDLLTRYLVLVPTLSEPHFVLAQLDRARGDTGEAGQEAALGKQYYTSDLATARRAAGYYENTQDWPDARFFLNEIAGLAPTDFASLYDLAKVTYLAGDPAGAETVVAGLRVGDPSILASDPQFLAAITAYEQSTK